MVQYLHIRILKFPLREFTFGENSLPFVMRLSIYLSQRDQELRRETMVARAGAQSTTKAAGSRVWKQATSNDSLTLWQYVIHRSFALNSSHYSSPQNLQTGLGTSTAKEGKEYFKKHQGSQDGPMKSCSPSKDQEADPQIKTRKSDFDIVIELYIYMHIIITNIYIYIHIQLQNAATMLHVSSHIEGLVWAHGQSWPAVAKEFCRTMSLDMTHNQPLFRGEDGLQMDQQKWRRIDWPGLQQEEGRRSKGLKQLVSLSVL